MGRTAAIALVAASLGWFASACELGGRLQERAPEAAVPATEFPTRIVSLVPALTETLFAIGAGHQVIAVSGFDTFPPEVRELPRVGALLDPDMERILALRPDLVVAYGSQSDLHARFDRAGIRVYQYRHGGIATVLETIHELGALTGHTAGAERLAADLESRIDRVQRAVRGRQRPRTVLVLERQPNTLRSLYASGGIGFLHEILEVAGGENVFGDVAREAVQPSHETLLIEAPDVVIEIRATGDTGPGARQEVRTAWSVLGTVPAVRNDRLHLLAGQHLVIPGPRLGQAAEALVRVLHPDALR